MMDFSLELSVHTVFAADHDTGVVNAKADTLLEIKAELIDNSRLDALHDRVSVSALNRLQLQECSNHCLSGLAEVFQHDAQELRVRDVR